MAATSADKLMPRAGVACQLTHTHGGFPHVLTVDAAGTYARARSTVIIGRAFRNSDCGRQNCESEYKLMHDIPLGAFGIRAVSERPAAFRAIDIRSIVRMSATLKETHRAHGYCLVTRYDFVGWRRASRWNRGPISASRMCRRRGKHDLCM